MNKEIPQLLKGFRDYLPDEQLARRKVIAKISEVFERFGFSPLDTPALESYELFKGKLGEDEKLMYKFEDLGGREIALRYDLTVPLARVVGQYRELVLPFKRYQIGNVWRADKPQKGRFREFMQCDIDVVGSSSINADVEVIAALVAAFKSLEIGTFEVKYNDRKLVDEVLGKLKLSKEEIVKFMRTMDKLDKIGEEKVVESLREQGLDKNIWAEYTKIMDESSREYVTRTEELLAGAGVTQMRFDKYLMRGLDYYTGIVFEFTLLEKPEFGSVGSGGRYDNLIENITGVKTPAVGGSIGLDRLLAALEEMDVVAPQTATEVIVFNLDASLTANYLNMTTNLRDAGIDTEFFYEPAKLDKQFKYAESKNMQVAVIVGPEEAGARKVNLKNLREKEQRTVDLDDLITEVKSMLW
ncbi:MAG TPA: histidine--tRNA ligase [Methylomirabilota bacterium]|jgi:histidyl-tRNA synthetase|nr:histidine--tRNA ligase [Methylomirabilota bacterium]